MRFKKSIVILFLVISPSLKSQTDVENKMITNDVDDINNEQFDIEKIRIRDSSRALKITFPLGQDTLRLTSDVDEIPHYIKIISQAFITPSDTVFCKIKFISNDSILLADCSFMWVDKNNLSKQSIVKKVSENKKYSASEIKIEAVFYSKQNNLDDRPVLVFNEINFQDEKNDLNDNNSSRVDVYPNPSKSGYIYTVQEPGQFDRIFVKDISKEKIIFEANKRQLRKKELRIDLTEEGSGRYMIVFSNPKNIVRERLVIH